MPNGFTVLITDRNRHVRNFLRREFIAEGYQVEVAADGRELLRKISEADPPDLLILDLEITPLGGAAILRRIQRQHPKLPVIIHTFTTEESSHPAVRKAAAFVEKAGNVEFLKKVVERELLKFYPLDFVERVKLGK
jgi:DNA-binding response OmpR family regulator